MATHNQLPVPAGKRVLTAELAGMRSVHCARVVFTALNGVEGVLRADVSMGRAALEHDGSVTVQHLRDAVEPFGYTVLEWTDKRTGLPLI